ncbi:MAG: hypothetical protein IPL46_35800 [Saprospiraceae bacterium]|nr:hypothetical protein [Saprospiraceae bacterium]
MKKIYGLILLSFCLASCGGHPKADGIALAEEVCECRKKGKGLKFADPTARKIRLECSKLQGENWAKIIRDKAQEEAFNKRLTECTNEMLEAMGK